MTGSREEPDFDAEPELVSDEPAPAKRTVKVRTRASTRRKVGPGRGKGNASPGHPRMLKAKLRAADALESRLESKSWREVARIHGYGSAGHAHDAVMNLVREVPASSREELRAIMDMQLDDYLAELWPRFKAGDLEAGRLLMRALDRRAKLLGLDAITDADYVAIASVQGLLGAIFDAALRLLPEDAHAAFLEDAERTLAQLNPAGS